MPIRRDLSHIVLPSHIDRVSFTPVTGGDRNPTQLTARQQRYLHASKLDTELTAALSERMELIQRYQIPDDEIAPGVCFDVEGAEHLPLAYDSFEDRRSPAAPIELLNVRIRDTQISATLYVPASRMESFKKKIAKYGNETVDQAGTKKSTLNIDSIEAIKLADLASFWMEDALLPTNRNQQATWEVWLRSSTIDLARAFANRHGMTISAHALKFQECDICLVTGSMDQLALMQLATAAFIGFRYREASPAFFTELTPAEQVEWVHEYARRLTVPAEDAPAVCVLDTGVRTTHPLLTSAITQANCDAYDPTWGTDDHHGHGTGVAGLALYGDLTPHLAGTQPLTLQHRLESVKILPRTGQNPEELYGWITQECVARAEVSAPARRRVFCMAITSAGNTNGRPTAWSATIDKLSMGVDAALEVADDNKRLFVISAGNIVDLAPGQYPNRNDLESIENPAQSWNALTVGACTDKAFSDDRTLDGWALVAQVGALAPRSRTSRSWVSDEWPLKPDVVLEGGNCIADNTLVSDDPDLSLLTTGLNTPIVCSRDTSAAAAQAARMAAILQAQYPNFWPETLRGLIVHSAAWHPAMLDGREVRGMRVNDKETLLRRYGYGVPNLENALFSASNRVCLIAQEEMNPFLREENDSTASYREMNIHLLPWPVEVLNALGGTQVQLRITLSYFIEPSPSQRIPKQKYAYASHAFRFDLQRPLESLDNFRQRVNKQDRARVEGEYRAVDTNSKWMLGPNARDKGSIVSDVWSGTAAELAAQAAIAVMPEAGWWKNRKHLNRSNQKARYSLIATLETPAQDVDIYTPIRNLIRVPTEITIR